MHAGHSCWIGDGEVKFSIVHWCIGFEHTLESASWMSTYCWLHFDWENLNAGRGAPTLQDPRLNDFRCRLRLGTLHNFPTCACGEIFVITQDSHVRSNMDMQLTPGFACKGKLTGCKGDWVQMNPSGLTVKLYTFFQEGGLFTARMALAGLTAWRHSESSMHDSCSVFRLLTSVIGAKAF